MAVNTGAAAGLELEAVLGEGPWGVAALLAQLARSAAGDENNPDAARGDVNAGEEAVRADRLRGLPLGALWQAPCSPSHAWGCFFAT